MWKSYYHSAYIHTKEQGKGNQLLCDFLKFGWQYYFGISPKIRGHFIELIQFTSYKSALLIPFKLTQHQAIHSCINSAFCV
jgi:hypothetical protein